MSSDEERLEELLRSVTEGENTGVSAADSEAPQNAVQEETPLAEEIPTGEEFSDAEESPAAEEPPVDPLAFMALPEEEVDKILSEEGAKKEAPATEGAPQENNVDLTDLLGEGNELSDIQELLDMSENYEKVSDLEAEENLLLETEEKKEDTEAESSDDGKAGKAKKERKKKKEKKEKKESDGAGFWKRVGTALFGSDDDEITKETGANGDDMNAENMAIMSELDKEDAAIKEKAKKAGKKEKKKGKKGKADKKGKNNAPDPKKAAKEKLKREKNAERARKKAEKAEIAAEIKRTEKKLPKKKVIVWVLLCGSVAAGILLVNSVGMNRLNLIQARNAYDEKDFQTAYELLNGRELNEEDTVLYEQSSVILHIQHVEEVYENHIKLEKPVKALEDLIQGVVKYQELAGKGREDLETPEASAAYQKILDILQENYGLSETDAIDIMNIEDDYEYSVQLEAIVNGEGYQSGTEDTEEQQEEQELEDILPEEEEYLNGSGN